MYKKRRIQIFPVLILLCFFYYIGEKQTNYEEQVAEMMEDVLEYESSEEKEIPEEEPEEAEEGNDKIFICEEDTYREEAIKDSLEREHKENSIGIGWVDKEEAFNENILGYTFQYTGYGEQSHYSLEPDWVLPEELVGKGVYISEHMCETEVFLGRKLAEVLADRGEVRDEDRQYYTDLAVRQLKNTDWSLLDADWEPDPCAYEREYWPSSLAGKNYYSYQYYFYPEPESISGSPTQEVSVTLLVNEDGVICGLHLHIYTEERIDLARNNGNSRNETTLCDERFRKSLMDGGRQGEGNVILDFSKYYQRWDEAYEPQKDTNMADHAERVADMCIDMLESRGEHTKQYKGAFYDESMYEEFAALPWNQTEGNWKAGEEYNCEYIDDTGGTGTIEFSYCFFPDYEKMGMDKAQAVLATCSFWQRDGGLICYKVIFIGFELSKEEYLSREKTADVQVVKKGEACDVQERISVPVPQTGHPHILVRGKTFDREEEAGIRHEETRICGYSDVAELAGYFGEKLKEDIKKERGLEYGYYNDSNSQYMLEKFFELTDAWDVCGVESDDISVDLKQRGEASVWTPGSDYDCFYVKENERAGCIHLRYYFYPQRSETENEKEWVLVLDAYVSEEGVEALNVNSFAWEV